MKNIFKLWSHQENPLATVSVISSFIGPEVTSSNASEYIDNLEDFVKYCKENYPEAVMAYDMEKGIQI